MATLYIDFTEPSPAPSQYRVRYKQTTDSTWTETTISSPPPFNITGTVATVEYDVEVYSDCGSSVFSSPDTDIAPWTECDSYTFENNTIVVPSTVTYAPCGYNDAFITHTFTTSGEVFGPVCIAVNSSAGVTGYTLGTGTIITATSSDCTVISSTGT